MYAQGGESLEDIYVRMEKALRDIAEKHTEEAVVVVSHGDPMMLLKAKIKNLPLVLKSIRPNKYIENGEVFLIAGDSLETLKIESVFIPQ